MYTIGIENDNSTNSEVATIKEQEAHILKIKMVFVRLMHHMVQIQNVQNVQKKLPFFLSPVCKAFPHSFC